MIIVPARIEELWDSYNFEVAQIADDVTRMIPIVIGMIWNIASASLRSVSVTLSKKW